MFFENQSVPPQLSENGAITFSKLANNDHTAAIKQQARYKIDSAGVV